MAKRRSTKKTPKKVAKKGIKKAAKKPSKKVAKKSPKKAAKKASKKGVAKKAAAKKTQMKAMHLVRLQEADILHQRMKDAGIPIGVSPYEGSMQPQASSAPADPKVIVNKGNVVIIQGGQNTSQIGSSHYLGSSSYLGDSHYVGSSNYMGGSHYLGSSSYVGGSHYAALPSHIDGDIVTVDVKKEGQMMIRTGDEAKQHANAVLNRFHNR